MRVWKDGSIMPRRNLHCCWAWASAQPITLFSRLPITSKHSFCPRSISIPCEPPSLWVIKQARGVWRVKLINVLIKSSISPFSDSRGEALALQLALISHFKILSETLEFSPKKKIVFSLSHPDRHHYRRILPLCLNLCVYGLSTRKGVILKFSPFLLLNLLLLTWKFS